MVVNALLIAGLVVLFGAALWRPWIALPFLLGLMPFNGLLLEVIAKSLGASGTTATLLAAWHDALAGGIIVAAAVSWITSERHTVSRLELLALAVFASGLVSVIIAPHLLTAVYAYRTLYEPIAVLVAIGVLARTRGLPATVWQRATLAVVIGASAASAFAIFQVYVGGIGYLRTNFAIDGKIPPVYLASTISQPRGLGPFTSPNEFGAYLVLALVILAMPAALTISERWRAWLAALIGFALLLSISRSAWVSTIVAMAILIVLANRRRQYLLGVLPRLRTVSWWKTFAAPAVLFLVFSSAFVFSSGLPNFIRATIGGQDPSAASHADSIVSGIGNIVGPKPVGESTEAVARYAPFGMGLGAAGAKSARFGETESTSLVTSETWYVNYLLQAGFIGLALLLLFAGALVVQLWRRRAGPLPRSMLAGMLGLAVGAIFIPVLDEPSVAVPLWSLAGLALASTLPGSQEAEPSAKPGVVGAS